LFLFFLFLKFSQYEKECKIFMIIYFLKPFLFWIALFLLFFKNNYFKKVSFFSFSIYFISANKWHGRKDKKNWEKTREVFWKNADFRKQEEKGFFMNLKLFYFSPETIIFKMRGEFFKTNIKSYFSFRQINCPILIMY